MPDFLFHATFVFQTPVQCPVVAALDGLHLNFTVFPERSVRHYPRPGRECPPTG